MDVEPPDPPDDVVLVQAMYSGTDMVFLICAQYDVTIPPPAWAVEGQKSIDAGSTWKGPDGTAGTWYGNLTSPCFCIAGDTQAMWRVRARNHAGASAWVNSANVAYVAP